MQKDWRSHKQPLQPVSGNVPCTVVAQTAKSVDQSPEKELPLQFNQKPILKEKQSRAPLQAIDDGGSHEGKTGKPRKMKVLEVRGETQTSKELEFFFFI